MKVYLSLILLFSFQMLFGQDKLTADLQSFYDKVIDDNGLVSYQSIDRAELELLSRGIQSLAFDDYSTEDKIAHSINAYNITVIRKIMKSYPDFSSVESIGSFFKEKQRIASQNISLDALEKSILKLLPDGRIHMVLNCGALSCPSLYNEAFTGARLEEQLEAATKKSLQDQKVVDTSTGKVSEIFRWYADDFEGGPLNWIKSYIDFPYDKLEYQTYDWSLNDADLALSTNGTQRYFASNLYSRGSYEVSMFNNYYTQTVGDTRGDWFTSTITALFGVNKRLNIGLDFRLRSTQNGLKSYNKPFGALSFDPELSITDQNGEVVNTTNSGLSAIGLRVKYQPVKTISNLTIQHIVYVPLIDKSPIFLDWEGPYIFNDVFYDRMIGSKSSIFLSAGFYVENINKAFFGSANGFYQVSTPMNAIYSYFPTKKSTVYGLLNIAPKLGFNVSNDGASTSSSFSPFAQVGVGTKYFLTDKIEAELLYTSFFQAVDDYRAHTFNMGLRYYGW